MSGRTPKVLVDTLPWLLYVLGNSSLDGTWKEQIDQCSKHSKLFFSAASVAECAALIKQEKLVLHQQNDKWVEQAILQSKTQIIPIDEIVAFEAEQLPKSPAGIHPYEKLILATARTHNISLLTKRQIFIDYATTGFLKIKS